MLEDRKQKHPFACFCKPYFRLQKHKHIQIKESNLLTTYALLDYFMMKIKIK